MGAKARKNEHVARLALSGPRVVEVGGFVCFPLFIKKREGDYKMMLAYH